MVDPPLWDNISSNNGPALHRPQAMMGWSPHARRRSFIKLDNVLRSAHATCDAASIPTQPRQQRRTGMAYYKKVLQPGETVRFVGKLHWLIFGRAILLFIVAAVLAWVTRWLLDPIWQHNFNLAAAVIAILALAAFIIEWIRRQATEFVVTDRRVIYKRGLISRHSVEMNISKVETVDVEQSVMGRLLNYGTVLVRGTGESLEPLRHVDAPLALRNAIIVG
jgi:membrane protein YdbS with pleckstrin-like domain